MDEQAFLQSIVNTMCAVSINPAALVRTLPTIFGGMAVSLSPTSVTLSKGKEVLTATFPKGSSIVSPEVSGGVDLSGANAVHVVPQH